MSLRPTAILLCALALVSLGCSRADFGGVAALPTDQASESSGLVPSDPPQTPSVPSPTVPPLLDQGEFWATIGGAGEMTQEFGTLDALLESTDVAVVGVATDFREGRTITFPETGESMYLAEVRVRTEQTLRGKVVSPDAEPGVVVIESSFLGFAPNPSRLAEVRATAPIGSRVLLFLVNVEADADRHGSPDDAPYRGGDYLYVLPHGVQAVIREESGVARIGPGAEEVPWLVALEGRSFDEVVREIETELSTSRTRPGS